MLAIIFCAGACGTAVRPSPKQGDARAVATVTPTPSVFRLVPVLLIGDSLMVGALDIGGLQGLLAENDWNAEIVAEVGAGLPWALQQVEPRLVVPRIVVIEMGTNPSPALGDFENQVRTMIDALVARGARHIIWIPPEARDPTEYAEKDAAIARAASSHVQVSGWTAKLEENPQWFGANPHLTQEGYKELALFLTEELRPLHG